MTVCVRGSTGSQTDNRQRVVLNGEASEWPPVTSSVPKDSVLEPTGKVGVYAEAAAGLGAHLRDIGP